MSRHHDRLADLIAHLSPTDVERDRVGLFMCELLVDLLAALTGGEQEPAEPDDGQQNRAGDTAGPAPSGEGDEEAEGGAPVQLQEPDVPPADDDVQDAGINDSRDRALAEQTTPAARSGRPPARKATAKKATTKRTTTTPAE